MQFEQYELMLYYAAPGIFAGIILGYIIGGRGRFSEMDRIATGAILSLVGGFVVAFVMSSYFPMDEGLAPLLFSIVGFFGGCAFGQLLNWVPYEKREETKTHIIFEPEDEEEYDREIEEVFEGKY